MRLFAYLIILLVLWTPPCPAKLRVLTADEPPVNMMRDGKLIGTSVDIVREIMRRTGCKADIEFMPWARAMEIGQHAPNVVVFTAGRTEQRIDEGWNFLGPVVCRKHGVYRKRGSPVDVSCIEDIVEQALEVSAIYGDWRELHFKKMGVVVVSSTDYKRSLNQVLLDRVPLVISTAMEIHCHLNRMNVVPGALERLFVFRESPSFIMFSKGTSPVIIRNWKMAFENMQQTDFFEKTAAKYHELLGLPFIYSPDKGFHVAE